MDHGRGSAETGRSLSEAFERLVRTRRMRRAFRPDPVAPEILERLWRAASSGPSAGKAQGLHLVVLAGPDTARFWDCTLPPERRAGFAFPGLLDAPVIVLPYVDASAYVDRYAEPDKAATGLGAGPEAWPVPYWTVDGAMAVMLLLLAAHDEGLGALLFAVFSGAERLAATLGVPDGLVLLGAVALGHPLPDRPGRSAARPRRAVDDLVHLGGW